MTAAETTSPGMSIRSLNTFMSDVPFPDLESTALPSHVLRSPEPAMSTSNDESAAPWDAIDADEERGERTSAGAAERSHVNGLSESGASYSSEVEASGPPEELVDDWERDDPPVPDPRGPWCGWCATHGVYVSYWFSRGLVCHVKGRFLCSQHIVLWLLTVVTIGLVCLGAWAVLPKGTMRRGGAVFDPVVTVSVGWLIGAPLSQLCRLPLLLGVFFVAVAWGSVPSTGYFTSGITPTVLAIVGQFGLAVILVRLGFALNMRDIRKVWKNAIALATVPFLVDAAVSGLVGFWLFQDELLNYRWAMLLGAASAAVSPGVVVPGILDLHRCGYDCVVSNLVVASVGMEGAIAFSLISIAQTLALSDGVLWELLLIGLAEVVGGIVAGLLAGIGFCLLAVCLVVAHEHQQTRRRRVMVLFMAVALAAVMGTSAWDHRAAGVTTAVVYAAFVSVFLRGHKDARFVEQHVVMTEELRLLWEHFAVGPLFAIYGSTIDLSHFFSGTLVWKGLASVGLSVMVRSVMVCLTTIALPVTTRQRAFAAWAWTGKATVQVFFAVSVAAIVTTKVERGEYRRLEALAAQRAAGAFRDLLFLHVLITAPIAATGIRNFGPMLLRPRHQEVVISRAPATESL